MMSRASSSESVVCVKVSNAIGVGNLKCCDFRDIRNDLRHIGSFAQRALNLVVIAMADQHQRITLLGKLHGLNVNLGDERAGGVDHPQSTPFAAFADGRRNTVGGVNYTLTVRHVVDLVNKNGALFGQFIHNIAVMDNFAANVNRRAKGLKRNFDDVDGTNNAGAKAARFEQKDPLLTGRCFALGAIGDRIKRSCSHTTIISIGVEFPRAQRASEPAEFIRQVVAPAH